MTPTREFFQVIVNGDRCYTIWPFDSDVPVPPEWTPTGVTGSLDVVLNHVAEQWRAGLRPPNRRGPASTIG